MSRGVPIDNYKEVASVILCFNVKVMNAYFILPRIKESFTEKNN